MFNDFLGLYRKQYIYVSIFIYILIVVLGLAPAQAFVTVRDDLNRPVTMHKPAQRIIALSPHLTENLFAIGAGGRVVGVVSYSDYPKAAQRFPLVGGYNGFDLEKIRALKPDLIVAWYSGNPPAQLAKIEALGIPIFYDNAQRLQDVPTVLTRLGQLTDLNASAALAAGQFKQRWQHIVQRYQKQRPVRVFYQVWDRPLMSINKKQIISDVMQACGAVNVFAELPALVPTVDEEAVLVANPELILTSASDAVGERSLARWQRWPNLLATQNNQLVTLSPDILSRMGPRLVDGAAELCAAVQRARQVAPR